MLFIRCCESTAHWAVRPTVALLRRLRFDPENQEASDYSLLEDVVQGAETDISFACLPSRTLKIDASCVTSRWKFSAGKEPLNFIDARTILERRVAVRQLLMIVGASAKQDAKKNRAVCLEAIRRVRLRRKDIYSQFLQWTREVEDA